MRWRKEAKFNMMLSVNKCSIVQKRAPANKRLAIVDYYFSPPPPPYPSFHIHIQREGGGVNINRMGWQSHKALAGLISMAL